MIALAGFVFYLCLVKLFTTGISPRATPRIVSSESARKHLATIGLVRLGEAFVVVPLVFLALIIVWDIVCAINPFRSQARAIIEIPGQPVVGEICSVTLCIIILVLIFFIGRKLIERLAKFNLHTVFEKILQVNTNSVSTFSFVFAAVSAHDFYQLMPAKSPEPGPGVSPFLVIFFDRNMWFLVFWGVWRLVYVVACRVLELNPPRPPASSADLPCDPDTPEFPKKSPLVQM